ncbi:hypothetical protein ACHAPE_007831 [Trichoderma viride]
MSQSVSRKKQEVYRDVFPGTAEQAKRFQDWIKEEIPWLHFTHVTLWLAAEMDIFILHEEDGEHIPIIREALAHIALDSQMEHSPDATIMRPGFGQPLEWMPADNKCFPVTITNEGLEWTARALLIRELCMLKVIEEITEKPDWSNNVRNSHVTTNWKKEILALDWSKHIKYADFTSSMAEKCIQELKLKADIYEKTGLIPVLDDSACVIKSNTVVSDGLKKAFAGIATELRYVDSYSCLYNGGLLVHQAHTSLCPLVYGRSRILPSRTIKHSNCLQACGEGDIIPRPRDTGLDVEYKFCLYDNSYQWLPFDVTISKKGNARIDSYINNLHPVKDKKLYSIISKAINHALPAWDIVYRWPHRFSFQRIPGAILEAKCEARQASLEYERRATAKAQRTDKVKSVQTGIQANTDTGEAAKCQDCQPLDLKLEHNESEATTFIEEEPSISKWFIDTHPIELPEPSALHFRLSPSDVKSSGFFYEKRRIQVMVGFGEIQLTPENPEFVGDIWETDGQLNEHIVSTAMFCYDVENITDSFIYFGAIADGENLGPGPFSIPEEVTYMAFGILPAESNFQILGRAKVHPDSAIIYPNVYKHRHGPVALIDRSKKGHLKYFKLYLVDPAIPIISTANVPPQQYSWWTESEIHKQGLDIVQRLPPELKEVVHKYVDFPIDRKEEGKIHKEIRRHRSELGECLHWIPLYDGKVDDGFDWFRE